MKSVKSGLIDGVIAFTMRGVYPLYWHLLQTVGATEILINRMLWSFVTLGLFNLMFGKLTDLKRILMEVRCDRKKLLLLLLATFLLGLNWFIFAFAVVSGRLLEASLGYYINPLLSIVLGVIFLKEKINRLQFIAFMLAAIAVFYLTLSYGTFPWLSVLLAMTFGCYGLVKKFMEMDATLSLFIETGTMLPISLFVFTFWIVSGTSTFVSNDIGLILLLIGAGFITMSPMYFFTKAAKVLPLKTLGFLQYIEPTLQLLVATFLIGEVLSTDKAITFILIWIACLIFSVSHFFSTPKKISKFRKSI